MSRRRKIRIQGDEEEEPTLDISSLIDVSFLLLIYFLVTATLQPQEVDVGLSLPSMMTPPSSTEERPLTLRLNDDGSVVADPAGTPQQLGTPTEDFEFPELSARLQTFKNLADQRNWNAMVVLMADDNANHQQLMSVFNAITGAGITDVTLSGFRDG